MEAMAKACSWFWFSIFCPFVNVNPLYRDYQNLVYHAWFRIWRNNSSAFLTVILV